MYIKIYILDMYTKCKKILDMWNKKFYKIRFLGVRYSTPR